MNYRTVARFLIAAAPLLWAPACSGSSGSGALGCPGGFDAAEVTTYVEADSRNFQCGGQVLPGTRVNGASCQTPSDCAPTCCACPTGSYTADVAWCNMGTCVVGADACCAWLSTGGGTTGLCR